MRKTLPVLAGLAGALLVSGTAEAVLTGLTFTVKQSAQNPRLFICNLYATFSTPGDNMIALVGLPAVNGPPLLYSTNSVPGFHQVTAGLGPQDRPIDVNLRAIPGLGLPYEDDTYITIGLKHGFPAGALSMATLALLTSDAPPGSQDWNVPGGALATALGPGGSYFVLPGAPEAVEVGGQVLIAQLVIDGNLATTDGQAPRIDVFIPQIVWGDAAANSFSEGLGPANIPGPGFMASHIIPAPGTLALLGLAGLAGIRRRRR